MRKFRLPRQNANVLWFFLAALIILFIPTILLVAKVLRYTHGVFMYPFDDTFIHLTIADNLLKGNWGINPNEFASASSSILYTLILALFRFFSKTALVPFIANCFAAIGIIISLHFWLKKHLNNYKAHIGIFFLVVLFTPLPLMIISGMEHSFQCLFSFLFIFYFSDWLEQSNKSESRGVPAKILFFAILVSTIRYEGLFLIATACLLLLVYKKVFSAIVLGVVSVIPLLIFGFISLRHGNYFLPNSVLVKSGTFGYSNPLQVAYEIVFDRLVYARNGMAALATQRLLIVIPLLYIFFRRHLRPSYFFILVFLFSATVLQLSFASTGYMYRYEAYLFFCFMIILPLIFYKYGRLVFSSVDSVVSKLAVLIIVFFLFFPVILRSVTALDKTPQACINIFDQQYQMAKFAKQNYDQQTVALNDIGAVGYYTNSQIIDLWGLANAEVTKSKKEHFWTPAFLDSLCKSNKVKLAIVYDSWFSDSLTKKWDKAATWEIQNNVICGDSIISFYAMDSLSKNLVQQQLKLFQPQLPKSVVVKYF